MGLLGLAWKRIYSESLRVGIRKSLSVTHDDVSEEGRSPSTGAGQVRIATLEDIEAVLDPARGGANDPGELWERRLRHRVADTLGPGRCYVADLDDKGPSFMQYVFVAEDNDALQARFPEVGPRVGENEALVEFLYVPPDARSLPFVADCLRRVASEVQQRGAMSLITYTGIENAGALIASHLAGYRPFAMRRTRYRLGRRSISYEPYEGDIPGLLRRPPG